MITNCASLLKFQSLSKYAYSSHTVFPSPVSRSGKRAESGRLSRADSPGTSGDSWIRQSGNSERLLLGRSAGIARLVRPRSKCRLVLWVRRGRLPETNEAPQHTTALADSLMHDACPWCMTNRNNTPLTGSVQKALCLYLCTLYVYVGTH